MHLKGMLLTKQCGTQHKKQYLPFLPPMKKFKLWRKLGGVSRALGAPTMTCPAEQKKRQCWMRCWVLEAQLFGRWVDWAAVWAAVAMEAQTMAATGTKIWSFYYSYKINNSANFCFLCWHENIGVSKFDDTYYCALTYFSVSNQWLPLSKIGTNSFLRLQYPGILILVSHLEIELSSNSTWLLVGGWLFCIQHLPCLVSFWCMLGGRVNVWMKNILYWFVEGQT